jgi:hypothetical protein
MLPATRYDELMKKIVRRTTDEIIWEGYTNGEAEGKLIARQIAQARLARLNKVFGKVIK